MPLQDTHPTPAFGGFGLSKRPAAWSHQRVVSIFGREVQNSELPPVIPANAGVAQLPMAEFCTRLSQGEQLDDRRAIWYVYRNSG